MTIPQGVIKNFQKEILGWYEKHKRDLPWRRVPFNTLLQRRDPYLILVSEIMLQQTQVSRVIPKYDAWLKRFPTVNALADAPVSEVLRYWSGLGYNRRALNLQKCAKAIIEYSFPKIIWPRTEKELMAMPGIGKYTARAVMCFAFNAQVAVVDTNVKKVILTKFPILNGERKEKVNHLLQLHDSGRALQRLPETQSVSGEEGNDDPRILNRDRLKDQEIWKIAERLVPHGKAYEWNQALMDYAGVVLKQEKIAIPKQTKFTGSRRYYRGKVLKVLLENHGMEMNEVGVKIKDEYTDKDREWLEDLIDELIKEGFVIVQGQHVHLL